MIRSNLSTFELTAHYPPANTEPINSATPLSPAAAADYGGFAYRPPESESQRGAGVYRREYIEPDPPRDAINSLGDEMVMLAAGFGVSRTLPFAVRMGRQGIASLGALSSEAEQAAAAISRSFMNRLGRLPSAKELFEALGPTKIVSTETKPNDESGRQPPSSSPFDPNPGANQTEDAGKLPVNQAQQILGEMDDRLRGLGGRTFQSYTKKRLELDRYYAGLTSGMRPPDENVLKRDAAKYPSPNYEQARLDRASDRYSSIRGREQQLIDYFHSLGTSENRYNSVALKNRLRNYYMRNAET